MLTREQAYKDYLDQYRTEIDKLIKKANIKHKTYINISIDKPKEIIDELKSMGYIIKKFNPESIKLERGDTLHVPPNYEIRWDKEE